MSLDTAAKKQIMSDYATVEGDTGNVTIYRKANKPVFGPFGDSLDDFIA